MNASRWGVILQKVELLEVEAHFHLCFLTEFYMQNLLNLMSRPCNLLFSSRPVYGYTGSGKKAHLLKFMRKMCREKLAYSKSGLACEHSEAEMDGL